MKKVFSLISILLCVCTLCGCVAMEGTTIVNPDGSVYMESFRGFTEEGYEMYLAVAGEMTDAEERSAVIAEWKAISDKIERNGVTYYGEWKSVTAESFEQYNEAMLLGENPAETSLKKNPDGTITFTKTYTPESQDEVMPDSAGGDVSPDDSGTPNAYDDMYVLYKYVFPAEVEQLAGPEGIAIIAENTILFDDAAINKITEKTTFVFKTKAVGSSNKIAFDDVKSDSWYYDAVMALAQGGLVNGVSSESFAPDQTLTYAQFCQILARASGLTTGEANGYWAAQAIDACVDAGYVISRGKATPANYDTPIPREAAVAAMYTAKYNGKENDSTDINIKDIPDYEAISPEYQDAVLGAYRTNITKGVDETGRFEPKNTLKRSEVCQLFYNSGWTTAK